MIATLTHHISFIKSPFLTKNLGGFQFKSSFCGKDFEHIPNCLEDLACIVVQGGLVLDHICNVIYGAFFTIARPFLDTRNFFHDFFLSSVF